jgi:hypothetical protein
VFRIALTAFLALLPRIVSAQTVPVAPDLGGASVRPWTVEMLDALPYPSEGVNPAMAGAAETAPCIALRVVSFWHVAYIIATI